MCLPDRYSLRVSGHHGDGRGRGREQGGAAVSCGGGASGWSGGVLGEGRTFSVRLPQRCDPPC